MSSLESNINLRKGFGGGLCACLVPQNHQTNAADLLGESPAGYMIETYFFCSKVSLFLLVITLNQSLPGF